MPNTVKIEFNSTWNSRIISTEGYLNLHTLLLQDIEMSDEEIDNDDILEGEYIYLGETRIEIEDIDSPLNETEVMKAYAKLLISEKANLEKAKKALTPKRKRVLLENNKIIESDDSFKGLMAMERYLSDKELKIAGKNSGWYSPFGNTDYLGERKSSISLPPLSISQEFIHGHILMNDPIIREYLLSMGAYYIFSSNATGVPKGFIGAYLTALVYLDIEFTDGFDEFIADHGSASIFRQAGFCFNITKFNNPYAFYTKEDGIKTVNANNPSIARILARSLDIESNEVLYKLEPID